MGRYLRYRYVAWVIRYVVWFALGSFLVWTSDGPWPRWGVLAAAMFACLMAEIADSRDAD